MEAMKQDCCAGPDRIFEERGLEGGEVKEVEGGGHERAPCLSIRRGETVEQWPSEIYQRLCSQNFSKMILQWPYQ
jgi:hypothetical protein